LKQTTKKSKANKALSLNFLRRLSLFGSSDSFGCPSRQRLSPKGKNFLKVFVENPILVLVQQVQSLQSVTRGE